MRFDPSGTRNKLLQPLADGDTIAVAAARTLLSCVPVVIAVVREEGDAVAAALASAGCIVRPCADAHHGMGNSLAHGVHYAAEAAGWIVALADMPYVKPDTVTQLANALTNGAAIAMPVCGQQRGHPVAFSAHHLSALLALRGDQGARALLDTCPVVRIAVDDPGIYRDIDTQEDLVRPVDCPR